MDTYILITGASSGIGRAIAITLSKHSKIILCGRDADRLAETQSMCNQSNRHLIWQYDLQKIEGVGKALKQYMEKNDTKIAGFVHSAGIAPISPLRLITLADMQKIMNVNFFAAAEMIKVLVNKKINKNFLCNIVFISSIYSVLGVKGQSTYCASKGAIDGLMRSLAEELAPFVRVNSVLPGSINTEMAKTVFGNNDLIANMEKQYLLGFGKPEYVANMVEFLFSDKALWITGQIFKVDGGRSSH